MLRLAMLSLLVVLGCSGSQSDSAATGGGAQPERVADEPGIEPVEDEGEPEPRPTPTPAPSDFERFVLTGDEMGCPAQARGDCHSMLELLADGTLRLDAWGEPGGAVLEVHLAPAAVQSAAAAMRAPALVDLLDRQKACDDANATESMPVRAAGADHRNETGNCNEDAIQSARGAAIDLVSAHLSGHSLISPPF